MTELTVSTPLLVVVAISDSWNAIELYFIINRSSSSSTADGAITMRDEKPVAYPLYFLRPLEF